MDARTALVLALALVIATPFAAGSVPRSETDAYVNVGGDFTVSCLATPAVNVGGGCFELDGSESAVTITIADDVFAAVGGYYSFADAGVGGNPVGEAAAFCSSVTVDIPAGAVVMFVYVDQAYSSLDCPDPSAGTTGEITADFV